VTDPPPEAYGRVTNADRYRVLHTVASELLDRLEAEYVVERVDGVDLDPEMTRSVAVESVTRLLPATEAAAPLTVALTRFPGLIARYGRWHVEAFPACGCDACDDDPDWLTDRFLTKASLLVDGRLREAVVEGPPPALTAEFEGQSWSRLDRDGLRRLGGPREYAWAPWPRR